MKKRFIAAVVFVIVVLLLGAMYWSGYLVFHGPFPSLTLDPGTTQSESTDESEGAPRLKIERIEGRFNKISVTIKNIGDTDATSVVWSVLVKGGILKRIDVGFTGTIYSLPPQAEATVITNKIPFGFGRLEITVTVESSEGMVTHTAEGFKLLFLVVAVRM